MIYSIDGFVYRDKPKLLDQLREALRLKHYSRKTEKSYIFIEAAVLSTFILCVILKKWELLRLSYF